MTDRTQEQFIDELLDSMNIRDKDLLFVRLYAGKEENPECWRSFFEQVNLPAEPYYFNCLLTRMASRFHWDHVPEDIQPTLNGLRKKLAAKNAVQMMDALQLIRKLNELNVPVMVVKGGAMRLVLLPQIPRRMTDIDIVVPEERYRESYETALAAGYHEVSHVMYSIDLHKGDRSTVDIHYSMFKNNFQWKEPTEMIRRDAVKHTRQDAEFYIPTPEDIFLLTVINAMDNILQGSDKGPVTWLIDCVDLASAYSLDYGKIINRAEAFHVRCQFRTAVLLMERILPEFFAQLYASAGNTLTRRDMKRMRNLLHSRKVTQEQLKGKPFLLRAYYRSRFLKDYYIGIHHLDDSAFTIIKDIPDMLKRWQRVDHLYELPGVFLQTAERWKKEREESDRVQTE